MKMLAGFASYGLLQFWVASALLLSASLTLPLQAKAETIALSLPISGDAAELGRNFRTGAKLAIDHLAMEQKLFIADDGCDPDLASLAAQDVAQMDTVIVVGLLCNEPAKIIASELSAGKTPVLVAGARSTRLIKDREREEWNLWRLSPGDDYPVETAARSIAKLWRTTPYAIVDDGTIYARSFSDLLRQKMREAGLAPQFSDTFRAAQSTQAGLLRRLQRSGVTAVFLAASTTEDLFTIASDADKLGIKLDFMTTEALGVLPFLEEAELIAPGIRVIAPAQFSNSILESLLKDQTTPADIHVYMGFAAMQIVHQALANEKDPKTLQFAGRRFDTVLGTVEFAPDGSADFNPYRLMIWNGEELVEDGRD